MNRSFYLRLLLAGLSLAACNKSSVKDSLEKKFGKKSNNNDVEPSRDSPATEALRSAALGKPTLKSQAILSLAEIPELSSQKETIRKDLADLFCIHVYTLAHKSDFTKELSLLCDNQKPKPLLFQLDRYAKIVGDNPRAVRLSQETKGDYTDASYAVVYGLPIPPKWIKMGAMHKYMVQGFSYDYVVEDGLVKADYSADIGGDLQFGKQELNYKTLVLTPDAKTFSNEKRTELNGYQVHVGDPDIGIGTEHLIGEPNPDYSYFKTITLTIADEQGGSVLITLINVVVKHNGYPELMDKLISDTSTGHAKRVHDGLRAELAAYINK